MKTTFAVSLVLILSAAAPAWAGTTALIDLGRVADKTGTTIEGVTYNDLSIGDTVHNGPVPVVLNGAASTIDPAPLLATDNTPSGWTIALSLISTTTSGQWGNNGSNSAAAPYPDLLSWVAVTALHDNLYMNRWKKGRFTLAGLSDTETYNILFYANETSNQGDASMSFIPVTGGGTDFVTVAFQARNNATNVVVWDDVSPAGGVIAFDVQAAREGWMNFMSIEQVDSGPAGDTNEDGIVDAADFITLKRNFGTTSGAGVGQGNFDTDGDVDWADLSILMENMGQTGAAPAVPEPATLGLLAVGALAVIRRRRS